VSGKRIAQGRAVSSDAQAACPGLRPTDRAFVR
jgi:hypothetical protein